MIVNLLWQFSLFEDVDANSFQFLVKKINDFPQNRGTNRGKKEVSTPLKNITQ